MRTTIALIALVLAACAGSPAPSTPATSGSPSPSPSPSPTAPADARILLADGLSLGSEPFSVAAVSDAGDYAALWVALGKVGDPPTVDFGQEAVIFLGMAGSSSCPEVFERLVVDEAGGHVYAQWAAHPPNQPCTDDLQAQGVLIAVARAVLPQQFRLTLREQLICADCQAHPDQALVDLGS